MSALLRPAPRIGIFLSNDLLALGMFVASASLPWLSTEALAQFTVRESSLFENKYEGDVYPVPDYTEAGNVVASSDGNILTLDHNTGTGLLESDIWPTVADNAGGWTAEFQFRLSAATANATSQLNFRVGDAENVGQTLYGFKKTSIINALNGQPIVTGLDLSTGFHVFRVAQLPNDAVYHSWLDGLKLTNSVGALSGGENMWWGSGSGSVYGTVEMDYFRFTGEGGFSPSVPPNLLRREWNSDFLGTWENGANWSPTSSPNDNTTTAVFGDAITASRTVVVDTAVTSKAIEFDDNNSYAIAGLGSVNLDADVGNASIMVLNSPTGGHQFQAAVNLADDTDVTAAAGTRLDFNNTLSLAGNTLSISGAGLVNINNNVTGGAGGAVMNSGMLGGGGGIDGNLINTAAGTLVVEIAGTGPFDAEGLHVAGAASLAGTLDILLIDSFVPSNGDSFTVLTATSILDNGLTLSGDSTGFSFNIVSGNSLVLSFSVGVPGDYNGDGTVNAADYVVWRDTLGSTTALAADGNANGMVDSADYDFWRARFGNTSGAGTANAAATAVPEPTAAALLAISLGIAVVGQRCRCDVG